MPRAHPLKANKTGWRHWRWFGNKSNSTVCFLISFYFKCRVMALLSPISHSWFLLEATCKDRWTNHFFKAVAFPLAAKFPTLSVPWHLHTPTPVLLDTRQFSRVHFLFPLDVGKRDINKVPDWIVGLLDRWICPTCVRVRSLCGASESWPILSMDVLPSPHTFSLKCVCFELCH